LLSSELGPELASLLRCPVEEWDFEALEMAVRRSVLAWAARLIERWLQADLSDQLGPAVLCECGQAARYRDAEGRPVRDPGSVTYSAGIESATTLDTEEVLAEFTQRVLREATRRRFTEAERIVVLGDCAPFIGNLSEELFPRAIQIADRYHAKEYLSTVAKALYGAESPQAKRWAERRHEELDRGRFANLLRAVRRPASHSEEARKCFRYLVRNRERMRYPEFETQGLCTSTGVVEAGCKVVVGTRLKRAGMHWTLAGANAIIALRCSKLSGRFEDFWERRSQRRVA